MILSLMKMATISEFRLQAATFTEAPFKLQIFSFSYSERKYLKTPKTTKF